MTQGFHVFSNKLNLYLWKAHFFLFSPCLCMHQHTSFVSIQSCELNLLEYCITYLQIKHRFHPTSQREQTCHRH